MTDTPAAPPAARAADIATTSAIGVVALLLALAIHEATHALTALAQGATVYVISSGHVAADSTSMSALGNQLVCASATLANIALGLALVALPRALPDLAPRKRLFLWVFAAANGFSGAGYLMASPFGHFGDWTSFLSFGAEPRLAWQIGLTAAGALLYFLVLPPLLRPGIEPFFGKSEPERKRRKSAFTVWPWLAGSTAVTASALLNRSGLEIALLNGVGSFAGMCGVAHMGWSWSKKPRPDTPETPLALERSVPWIVAAVVLFVVDFLTLGPGIVLAKP